MPGYIESIDNGVTIYKVTRNNASTYIEIRDAITAAIGNSTNVFRCIIDTNYRANTPSEFMAVLDDFEVIGDIYRKAPGYRIAIIVYGNAGELFARAESLWEDGGFFNRFAAVAIFAIGAVDAIGNFERLLNNSIIKNDYADTFNSMSEAVSWVKK